MTGMKRVKAQPRESARGGDDAALRHEGRGDDAQGSREVLASTTERAGECGRWERKVRGPWRTATEGSDGSRDAERGASVGRWRASAEPVAQRRRDR